MQNLSLCCIGENNPDDRITSDKLGALTIRHHKLKNVCTEGSGSHAENNCGKCIIFTGINIVSH